ncbi:HAMP domain-containing histidine kinase [Microbacteriaceae bacterium VKM Ac-2854]|nr:HAMP domain-containing histidine kinase [Microbacteriaceae bacterium VKM Ac-2854]
MTRRPGLSVRLKLTLSYAGFLLLSSILLLTVVWLFLLRYVPRDAILTDEGFVPGQGDLIRAFAPAAGWALLATLLLGLVGGWFLAGRMLAPLSRITAATRRAAHGSLSHRIELPGAQDEFRELADSFDVMLARLAAYVAEQSRFAANASHELRTPLAITKTVLDVAGTDPGADQDELIRRLRAVNDRAIELTEALLLLSRSDGRSFERSRVDVSLLAEQAAETLLPLAERRGVHLEVAGDVAVTVGSPALLLQLVTNLIQNAIVHNVPAGGRAQVSLDVEGGLIVLLVRNTGPRLAPERIATLTEPFQRGAERTRSSDEGVGLGLAIARSIVLAHDGTLALRPEDGGGLVVEVRLSRAP